MWGSTVGYPSDSLASCYYYDFYSFYYCMTITIIINIAAATTNTTISLLLLLIAVWHSCLVVHYKSIFLMKMEMLPVRCEDEAEDDRIWLSLSLICITELRRSRMSLVWDGMFPFCAADWRTFDRAVVRMSWSCTVHDVYYQKQTNDIQHQCLHVWKE